jgi:hypothetical protein
MENDMEEIQEHAIPQWIFMNEYNYYVNEYFIMIITVLTLMKWTTLMQSSHAWNLLTLE